MLRPSVDNLSPVSYTQSLQQQNYLKILVPLPLAIRLFKQRIPKNWNFSRILKLGKEKKTKPSLMPARTYLPRRGITQF